MAKGKPASVGRRVITLVMDALVAVAVLCLVHLVAGFFGSVPGTAWGKAVLSVSGLFVVPFGVEPIPTPYAGAFDVNAAITVLALLGVEWLLGLARRNA